MCAKKGLRSLRFIDLSVLIIETKSTAAFTFGLERVLFRSENGKKLTQSAIIENWKIETVTSEERRPFLKL